MSATEPTLLERVNRMYRRLLLLQCLFEQHRSDDTGLIATGDSEKDTGLSLAISEVVNEVAGQARVLTCVPQPISDWRLGDGPDDDRWRGLTDLERRDLWSVVSGYENLLAWAEQFVNRASARDSQERAGSALASAVVSMEIHEAVEHLEHERSRLSRLKQDVSFLERVVALPRSSGPAHVALSGRRIASQDSVRSHGRDPRRPDDQVWK